VPPWPSRFCFPHGSRFCKNKVLASNQILIQKSFLDHLIHTWLKFMLTLCTKNEHPEKQWWWLSKLESLVVKIRDNKMDKLNGQEIVSGLAENIKQIFYEVYKVAYE
jgi:hypothetical protein